MVRKQNEEPEKNPDTEGAERALEESEALYRDLVENASDWLWQTHDGVFTYSNPAVERILGYRPDEVIGRNGVDFAAPEDRERVYRIYRQASRDRADVPRLMHRNIRKDGSLCWVEASAKVILDDNGNVIGFRGINRDVTDRVQTEEALAKSEERYRELAEGMSDWVWEIDLEGRCTYSNPAIQSILGYTPEEVIGKRISEFILPEYREEVVRQTQQAAAEGRGIVGSLTGELHKDGSIRYIETNARPVLDESGNPVGFRGMNRDVTARVEAERALEHEKERFQALIENSFDIVMVADAEGKIKYVSPSVEHSLGFKPEEMIGARIFDYVHPDDAQVGRPTFQALAEHEGMTETGREFRLRDQDGNWHVMEVTGKNMLGDPAVRGIIINHRDITERKQAEEALEESEERYRSLAESAVDAIVSADSSGRIISWNKAAEAMFGYTEEEVTGKPVAILMPERYRAAHTEGLERMRTGGEPRLIGTTREFEGTRKDGAELPLELSLTTWLTPRGRFYSAIIRDITERKQAEEALQKTYEQLRTMIDTSPLAIITLDLEGKVTSWNPAAEMMFGWTAEEVIGKPMPIIPDDQLPVFHGHLQRLLEGDILSGVEVPHIRKDGTRVEISVSIAGLHDSTGATIGFMGMLADITEQKRAAEALRESEGKYRQLVDMMNEGLGRADENYVLTYVNQKFADMLGYSPEEMLGRSVGDFVHEDARRTLKDQMERRKLGEAGSYELAWRAKDGRSVYALVSPRPVFDDAGNFAGSIAVLTDITERKKAEEAAQRKQQEVITLLNTLPGYVFFKDAKSVYITANEVFAKAVGVPASEIPGKTDYDLFPRELAEKYRADDRRLIEAGTSLEIGEEETVDGTRRLIVETRKVPLKDNRGNVIGLIGIALDVTERKEAEARLRELEEHRKEFYRRTIEAATEGKLVISERDEIERMAGPPIASREIHSGKDLSLIRQDAREIAREAGMDEDRICDFILAVGEATTNAFKHTGGGTASLHRVGDSLIVTVSDHGKGMEALALPAVALRRGYTTTTSLGMGYKAMLSIADKVYLATGPSGTTVAIEMSLRAPEISPALAALPDAWKM